jgi:amino acid adenylation domain-containing protein
MNTTGNKSAELSSEQKRALLAELLRKDNAEATVAPVSFPQRRLWFLDQLDPGNPTYNVSVAFRLAGSLDVHALERSLREIQRRHQSLRTTFGSAEGQPIQVVHRSAKTSLNVIDLSAIDAASRETEALRLAAVEGQARLDLAQGPLFRATLLKLAAGDHWLLLTMHHIMSDGWSMGVLTRELTTLYAAFAAGKPSPLEELSLQYTDVAKRQQVWAGTDDFRRQFAYWKKQLEEKAPPLRLPADRPRPETPTYRGAREAIEIRPDLSAAIRNLGLKENVTLFMTTVSAFYSLLYRYTSQEDLLVGSFIANRNSADVEGLIGFFVNTLVLRAQVTGDMTFRQLLSNVRQVTLEAYDHQDLPFERLVEELQPDRDLSVSPIFPVTFSFQNMPPMSLSVPGLTFTPQNVHNGMSKFDLSVYMWDSGTALGGLVEYSTDLFEAATIRRFLTHFETLLAAAVANPDVPIADLPLITNDEYRVISDWNATGAAYPADKSLQDLFQEQVHRTPEKTALISSDSGARRISYRELNGLANRIGRQLQTLGVRHGDRVGVFWGRSVEAIASILGILKCGAAYVALDPAYPPERLHFMIRDAGLTAIATESRLAERIAAEKVRTLCVDQLDQLPGEAEGDADFMMPVKPTDVAYVTYTSGSTGTPKGVLALHGATVNRLAWMWKAYPYGADEVCCEKTSLNFVDSVCEIFSPLLQGIPLVIISETAALDPELLVRALSEHNVTRIVLVPSLLRVLLDSYPDLAQRVPSLRFWVASGEALPVDLWREFSTAMPEAALINLYGSSEVAADVTCYDTREAGNETGSIPIGRPIANTQIWILDSRRRLVPIGVPGELYAGGAGLARGYLNRSDLTAERFVPNPFSTDPNARLYKTGDLARYRADGNIEYLGRMDHQVKIRGFRVEFEEVEAALRRHPDVRDAVASFADDAGGKRLLAYVAPGERKPTVEELQTFMQGILPDYMVPSAFFVLDALPRTPSGKIDRHALAGAASANDKSEVLTPRTETERQIYDIWRKILRVERIGIRDNFFRIGGHSLAAAQMAARIRAAFHIELPLADVFKFPTLEALATRIEDAVFAQSDPEALKQLLNDIEKN